MELYFGISNIIIGVLATLIGFKVYNPFKGKNEPDREKIFYEKFGTFFKIGGILITLVGIFKTIGII